MSGISRLSATGRLVRARGTGGSTILLSMTSDSWAALGGIAALVAAAAALVAIGYARATVREARLARQEAHLAHTEEVAEQRNAAEASMMAHQEETRQRREALAEEVRLQRVMQSERVAEILMRLADTAREELVNPPPQINGTPARATVIPAVLRRLGVAITLLQALGGPEVLSAMQLTRAGYRGTDSPMKMVSGAVNALDEIESLARNDDSLRLRDSGTPEGGS